MDIKHMEEIIHRAFEVDRLLPPVYKKQRGCLLGTLIIIPDDLRSPEDVLADIRERVNSEELKLWEKVMIDWLPALRPMERRIVIKRSNHMGWKRIARELYQEKLAFREFDRSTLWRIYTKAFEKISEIK